MDLRSLTRPVQEQLLATAAVGDDATRGTAQVLVASLEPALRLALQDAVGQVAAQVSAELAPGRVDLALRGSALDVHVVLPPAAAEGGGGPAAPDGAIPGATTTPPTATAEEEAGTTRVAFRPPQHLKHRLEQAAAAEGLSLNAYLVRALTAHLDAPPAAATSPGRLQGWYR